MALVPTEEMFNFTFLPRMPCVRFSCHKVIPRSSNAMLPYSAAKRVTIFRTNICNHWRGEGRYDSYFDTVRNWNDFAEIGEPLEGWVARGEEGTSSTGYLSNFSCLISAHRRNCLRCGCLYRERWGRLVRWRPVRQDSLGERIFSQRIISSATVGQL